MLLVDSGNVAADTERAAAIYKAMAAMGYDALGIGMMEAGLGQEVNGLAQAAKLPLVGQVGPGVSDVQPARLERRAGALTVGIVSAGWTAATADEAYRAALRKELEAARAESQFVILLSQLGVREDEALLALPGFTGLADVVVGGPLAWPEGEPTFVGQTLLLPGTSKGRELGVLEVQVTDERIRCFHKLVPLDPALPEDTAVKALVDDYYKAHQERPQTLPMGEAGDKPTLPDLFTLDEARVIRARGHLTAPECGRCHEDQLKQWQQTPHAKALQTLIKAGRTVRECLACHSEASRRGLPYDPEGADQWGVDCAACHGAGLYHASTEGAQGTIVRSPAEAVCRRCHTEERDTAFEFAKRLQGVRH